MRYHHMDFLRGGLMTVGVAYHVALVVRLDGWSISINQGVEAYGEVAAFLHTFRMHTFFLLSGFFAAMLLTRKGSTSYLRERLWRIAIPMVACGLTLQLLTFRDESWDANFWLGGAWVGHLWFLGNLLVYMWILAATFRFIQKACVQVPYWVFSAGVALGYMVTSSLAWRLPSSPFGSFWIVFNLSLLITYFPFYFAGAYLYLRPKMLESSHHLGINLALAIAGASMIFYFGESKSDYRFFGYGLWVMGNGYGRFIVARVAQTDHEWLRLGQFYCAVQLFRVSNPPAAANNNRLLFFALKPPCFLHSFCNRRYRCMLVSTLERNRALPALCVHVQRQASTG